MNLKVGENSDDFSWMHFSDLHLGSGAQSRMVPRYKTILLEDIKRVLARVGAANAIIFTGDLVQSGEDGQYDLLDELISEILEVASEFGARPDLVAIPGNHDLVRPLSSDPYLFALRNYWDNDELRDVIWSHKGAEYRGFVDNVFSGFTKWQRRAIDSGVHVRPTSEGCLPGDASYDLKYGNTSVGIVGLNSSWLQLDSDEYLGKLHVDVNQLIGVTDGDPDGWVRKRDISLLLTHHPPAWLRSSELVAWESEIAPSDRFDLHLFGHMHEPVLTSKSVSGGAARREIQSASLFGLEKFGRDKAMERIHGYSFNRLMLSEVNRSLCSWPRRAMKMADRQLKLVPDQTQNLDDETNSYFSINYGMSRVAARRKATASSSGIPNLVEKTDLAGILSSLRTPIGHKHVRRVEQGVAVRAMQEDRVFWLSAEWGMCEEGFLAAVVEQVDGVDPRKIYRLNVGDFQNSRSFLDGVREQYGTSFEQIAYSLEPGALLILDEIAFPAVDAAEKSVADIEGIARAVVDFDGDIFVVLKCARGNRYMSLSSVSIVALDEADLGSYLADVGSSRGDFNRPDVISKIFRLTDGVPAIVDSVISDLEFSSLDELLLANSDHNSGMSATSVIPLSLSKRIQHLANSEELLHQRAFEMLMGLAALPYGEQIVRLRRFLGVHPLGVDHARLLVESSLVNSGSSPQLVGDSSGQEVRTLLVPRLVREHLRESIPAPKVESVDRNVLELYFGSEWANGDISAAPIAQRVKQALCAPYEISNANVILLRFLNRVLISSEKRQTSAAVTLIVLYAELLAQGSHYNALSILCEDSLTAIGDTEGLERDVATLSFLYGTGLRMLGRKSKAREVLEEINTDLLSKGMKQRVAVELGFVNGGKLTTAAAREIVRLKPGSSHAMQAEYMSASSIADPKERLSFLYDVLGRAERKKFHILHSNINMEISSTLKVLGKDFAANLRSIVSYARAKGDFYNSARAVVWLSEIIGVANLDRGELDQLVKSYHFFYNERMLNLFNRCHRQIWEYFEGEGDLVNLLSLYRHSSFMWRLQQVEGLEAEYLRKIYGKIGSSIIASSLGAGRDAAYLMVRVVVVLNDSGNDGNLEHDVGVDSP